MSFLLDIHELPRRAVEYREYRLDLLLESPLGLDLISIDRGERILVEISATSVDEGVLIRANLRGMAKGECARCLEPVSIDVNQDFDELFEYPSKASALSKDEIETDEILRVEDDHVDLATPIRDAIPGTSSQSALCARLPWSLFALWRCTSRCRARACSRSTRSTLVSALRPCREIERRGAKGWALALAEARILPFLHSPDWVEYSRPCQYPSENSHVPGLGPAVHSGRRPLPRLQHVISASNRSCSTPRALPVAPITADRLSRFNSTS